MSVQRTIRNDPDTEAALKWRVSEEYWFKERGLTEAQYEHVVRGCTCSAAGFCESCMGKEQCEIDAIGFEAWHKKVFGQGS